MKWHNPKGNHKTWLFYEGEASMKNINSCGITLHWCNFNEMLLYRYRVKCYNFHTPHRWIELRILCGQGDCSWLFTLQLRLYVGGLYGKPCHMLQTHALARKILYFYVWTRHTTRVTLIFVIVVRGVIIYSRHVLMVKPIWLDWFLRKNLNKCW